MRILASLFIFLVTSSAHATFLEGNAFYSNDSLVQSTSTSTDRMFFDAAMGFSIDKKGYFQAGWEYDSFSATDVSGSTTTIYAATSMGPKFNIYFGKARQWDVSLFYGIVSNASYSSGATSETWTGTSYKAALGYIFRFDNQASFFGLRINYSSASYVQSLSGSSTYTAVSYSRTFLYPSITFGFDF